MLCQNCSSDNPEGQAFCGKCGHRLIAETVGSLSERLAKIEQRLAASQDRVPQQTLELETAANAMDRVKKWTTLFLYFAGIPVAIGALVLALMFGKGTFDLHSIAANAQTSVNGVLQQARSEASNAEATARGALETSKQVDANIKATQLAVSDLKNQVDARSADVQKLSAQLDTSRQQLDALAAKAAAQEAQFGHMTEQVKALQTAKGVEDVQTIYPIFGKHIARSATGGLIDPKQKPQGAVYLALVLSLTHTPNVSDVKAGDAVAALTDHKYTVTVGPVYVEARTANSAQNVGMGLDEYSCNSWVKPASSPPCILYFRASLKDSAIEIRNLVKVAQDVPDDRIFYLDPAKLSADQQETLNLSAMDFLVVLGQ